MANLVFLHGIGDGGIDGEWRRTLNASLSGLGYPIPSDVKAPRYVCLLRQEPSPNCPVPKQTVPTLDDATTDRERREYAKRQSSLERHLAMNCDRGETFTLPEVLPEFVVQLIVEARRYVNNDGLRGCVLQKVVDELPSDGDVVIVGHSLGSIVAMDLLDHLPPNLTVRRLVTIGSPAGHVAMHGNGERLLKAFPWSKVKSWVNIWSDQDPVPAGRGVSQLFPQALDVRIKLGVGDHWADQYLSDPVVAKVVGEGLFGSLSREIAPRSTSIECSSDDNESMIVAGLYYGHLLADELTSDRRRQAKFVDALEDVQRSVIAAMMDLYATQGRPVPNRLSELADGRRPTKPPVLSARLTIPVLVAIAGGNVIAPYEISVPGAQRSAALERLAQFLELPANYGTRVFEALVNARAKLAPGWGWDRWACMFFGGSLLLAAPVGLWLAIPAGLTGGAAIVSALAAFGPGGMLGGLITAGVLATAGAGTTVAALVSSEAPAEAVQEAVAEQLATAIARKLLNERRDNGPWLALCRLETRIAHERQRLEPFSDSDAPNVKVLQRKATIVRLAIEYLIAEGLAPILGVDGVSAP